jgi:hypothetical protein
MRLIGELGLEHQRGAFRDHVMIPFEELRGRLLDQCRNRSILLKIERRT